MFSWFSEQISTIKTPSGDEPHSELRGTMQEALGFEPVLTASKELEYKFVLEQICRASFEVDNRIIILDFLHYAFAPPYPNTEWRTIFNGLRILDSLVGSGSNRIFSEISQGKHFDVVQKTLFLTTYANSDERVAKLIRTAAREIRDKLLAKFDLVDSIPETEEPLKSISSKDVSGKATPDTIQPVAPSSIVNLVSLRHQEDSSDEEGNSKIPRPVPPLVQPVSEDLLLDDQKDKKNELIELL
jgi:hypothetical protein